MFIDTFMYINNSMFMTSFQSCDLVDWNFMIFTQEKNQNWESSLKQTNWRFSYFTIFLL
jgi:hypothetical protein